MNYRFEVEKIIRRQVNDWETVSDGRKFKVLRSTVAYYDLAKEINDFYLTHPKQNGNNK
jgi:hypothetical protein